MILGNNCGHTLSGYGVGATGNGRKEQDLTREVGHYVNEFMKQLGHSVIDCTIDKATSSSSALNMIVQKANSQYLDLFLSIHFNASNGQGNGTECYIFSYNDKTKVIGDRICNNFANLGYKNRGVKLSKNAPQGGLTVVDYTKAQAILVECCFIDNVNDMNKYNPKKFAKAIVEGILNIKINDIKYRIVTGTFNSKETASNYLNSLINLTGWYATIEDLNGKYRMVTGTFNNEEEVKNKLNALRILTGWWATYEIV